MQKPENHQDRLVFLLIGILAAWSMGLMAYRVNNFLTFFPTDTAFFIQALTNTLHGRFGEQTIYANFNAFSYHGFFSLLLLLLLMAIFQAPLFFCVLKNALVAFSAIPVWFIIKQNLEDRTARILIFLCYYLSSFLAVFGYCEALCQLFVMPVFAAAWLFYKKKRFRSFLAAMLVCLFTKESFPFTFLAWGIVGWWDRRPARWILAPVLASLAYFAAYHFLNLHFLQSPGRGNVNLYQKYYGQWGNSCTECIAGIFSHPGLFLRVFFNPTKWLFLFYVTFPFLPFLFLRPKLLLLSLPCVGIYFLMGPNDHVIYHPGLIPHFMEACLFSFLAFVETLAAWPRSAFDRKTACLGSLGLLALLMAGMALKAPLSDYMLFYNLGDHLGSFLLCILIWLLFLAGVVFWRKNLHQLVWATAFFTILLTFVFRFVIANQSMVCAEAYIFDLKKKEVLRNRVARSLLASVPLDKSLTIPAKYSIVCSNRSKVDIYNGDRPLSEIKSLSDPHPEYIFLDLFNYFTLFEPVPYNRWDRSPAESMISDQKTWEIVFYYDNLYLLHRNSH